MSKYETLVHGVLNVANKFRMLQSPMITVLGVDPERTHRINANSFQQNAHTTVHGWQYIAYYADASNGKTNGACYANLARRKILDSGASSEEVETLTFRDYEQVVDDGHNTISIGVCKGDGTIHMAFDHHCDQ